MKGLQGRTAVVTGAASGIGRAIAERLAEEGVQIVGVDRNAEALVANDKYASTLAVDLVDQGSIARVREHIEAGTGACDILVNAAGISAFGLFDDAESSLWDDTMAINVEAVARLTRELLPLLRASNQARIINIGSTCSQFATAGLSAYVVSKHAILGMTRALASELGADGITVNCIQPGAIVTAITEPTFNENPEFRAHWENKAALGRLGQPEDVAPLAAFLASEEARFISGHGMYVDGGAMQQN